jgi:membrane-bound ClpP family serine protease
MEFSKLFGFGGFLAIILVVLKLIAFQFFDLKLLVVSMLFGLVVLVLTVACTRRLGVINYLEAMLAAGLWFIMILLMDLIVTGPIVGYSIFKTLLLWLSYLLVIITVLLFHKKRHIAIRRKMKSIKMVS